MHPKHLLFELTGMLLLKNVNFTLNQCRLYQYSISCNLWFHRLYWVQSTSHYRTCQRISSLFLSLPSLLMPHLITALTAWLPPSLSLLGFCSTTNILKSMDLVLLSCEWCHWMMSETLFIKSFLLPAVLTTSSWFHWVLGKKWQHVPHSDPCQCKHNISSPVKTVTTI